MRGGPEKLKTCHNNGNEDDDDTYLFNVPEITKHVGVFGLALEVWYHLHIREKACQGLEMKRGRGKESLDVAKRLQVRCNNNMKAVRRGKDVHRIYCRQSH